MTKREEQRDATKKRIYDCAFQLFEKNGYQNVKVADIAKEAGVSIGGVYHHYKSKEEIIDYGYYAFDQDLQDYYEKANPRSPRSGIETLIDYQMQTCVSEGCSIISISFKYQINAENEYRYSKDRYLWKMLIQNLASAGLTRAKQEEAASSILRVSRGCVYDWCCRNGSFDLVREMRKLLKMILSYYSI